MSLSLSLILIRTSHTHSHNTQSFFLHMFIAHVVMNQTNCRAPCFMLHGTDIELRTHKPSAPKTMTEKRHNNNTNGKRNCNDDNNNWRENMLFWLSHFRQFFPPWFSISTSSFHCCEYLIILFFFLFISLVFCFTCISLSLLSAITLASILWKHQHEFDVVDELAKLYTMHCIML